MPTERNTSHPDDAGIEELLREVGARDEPSVDTSRDIETAVRAEWEAMLEERRRGRRKITWAVAAGLAIAIGAGLFVMREMSPPAVDAATVARIDGHLLVGPREEDLDARASGQSIKTHEVVQTDDQSRVALVLQQGVSVRMDRNTTLTFASAGRIVLRSGALYVDSPRLLSDIGALAVQTHVGSVKHVGTQYQVRTHADAIEVSVREGRVLIENEAGQSSGEAGERLRVGVDGEITRAPIAANDPSWTWAAQAAPRFDIDNQTLATFLDWLARETGRQVVYESPQAKAAARKVKLRGSIEGLDLETALTAVLSTTKLHRYETRPDAIGISLATAIDSEPAARPTP